MFPAERRVSNPSEPSEPTRGDGRHSESVARPITAGQRKVLALDLPPPGEVPVSLGDLVGGRYVVDRLIASGGMGVVCLATHAELGQRVAIKFMREAFATSDSLVHRFLNEARAAATLKSQHVVRVMDVGQLENGLPYLVMEHLEGRDLEAVLAQEGPLEVRRALGYVLEVCDALAEAHATGIVHRDIKPENLFLATIGTGREIVKVVDFGLAKRIDTAQQVVVTGPQDSMGSPCYMSPEQISTPQEIDARTDVWSLGVVLYRLLTGVMPFDGASILEVYARVLNAEPKPMHQVRPGLDPKLDAVVGRCLAKDPARRLGTVEELSAALSAYLAGSTDGNLVAAPVTASLPPTVEVPPPAAQLPAVPVRSHAPLVAIIALLSVFGGFIVGRDDDVRTEARAKMRDWVTNARKDASGPYAAMLDDANTALTPPEMPEETTVVKLYSPPLVPAAGVTSRWPARGRHRERLLAAEKERDMSGFATSAGWDTAAELREAAERRQDEYGEFLRRAGLTPVDEPPEAARPAPAPPPPAEPAPPPAPPLLNPADRSDEHSKSDLKPP